MAAALSNDKPKKQETKSEASESIPSSNDGGDAEAVPEVEQAETLEESHQEPENVEEP